MAVPFYFCHLYLCNMKKVLFLFAVLFVTVASVFAQNQYEVLVERPNEKTFKGILSREALNADTSFKWMETGRQGYTPNAEALSSLGKYKDSIQLLVFMGTWCEDSHIIIPKLFMLLDVAGFPMTRVTLIGTDRDKKTLSHLSEALNVKNVPSILVMKEGKEAGRVIEYGKTGLWDKELGETIDAAFKR